ncbi:hypothetical protein DH2020_045487 [Rehmannia glutinosa]|uniref:Uncharacterized protein n=1 Tax=Rehmannia glutinosa TaxID=99300 RepID=A0ABR0UE77_REHGL
MAPSTPPPPDTSNIATSTAATTRPLFQNPPRPPNPHLFYSPPPSRLPSNPNPNYPQLAPRPLTPTPHHHPQDPSQLLYPVASSGRGFLARPLHMPAAGPSPRPPYVFPYLDPGQGNPGFIRPNHLPHVLLGSGPGSAGNASGAGVMPGVVKGIPVSSSHHPKAGLPSSSISDNNGHKDLRDRRDDTFAIIRDRKVRISEDASLYSLCRSWLKNGVPEETQPQYLDTVKSLPRPLPVAAQVVDSPDKGAEDEEEEDEVDSKLDARTFTVDGEAKNSICRGYQYDQTPECATSGDKLLLECAKCPQLLAKVTTLNKLSMLALFPLVQRSTIKSPDSLWAKEVTLENVENLSAKESCKGTSNVPRRLREERLQRISRYKNRLALLLPPMVEQHFKSESADEAN